MSISSCQTALKVTLGLSIVSVATGVFGGLGHTHKITFFENNLGTMSILTDIEFVAIGLIGLIGSSLALSYFSRTE